MAAKKNTALALLLIGAAGLFVAKKAVAKKKKAVSAELKNTFGLFSVKMRGTKIVLVISYRNPTAQKITVERVTGSVFSGKTVVGNLEGFKPVTIEARKTGTMELTVTPKAAGLITTIKNLLSKKKKQKTTMSVQGIAKVNGVEMKFSFPFSV